MRDGLSSLFCSFPLSLSLSLPSALFCVFSPRCHPRFLGAAMFCFILVVIRGTNENSEGEVRREGGRTPRGWCPRVIATPSVRPPPFPPSHSISALHLSIFLSDSWQPVGYSGHASLPRCIHLPADLRKHVLTHVALLYLGFGTGGWGGKRNSTSTENESAGRHLKTWPHHKTNHLSRGPFSRSLKNNYMWTDSKF